VGMEIRDYLLALRRHGIAIVLLVLVGLGAGYGWASIQTPVYQAEASGFAKTNDGALPEGGVIAPGVSDSLARAKVATYVEMATWRTVAERAAAELKSDARPEDLVRRITVSNPQSTAILKVTAQGSSPEAARNLATAWVNGLIATIDETEGDGSAGSAPVNIILGESASLPSSPSFPDTRTALMVGGLLGLGAGIAFAIMRAISDRRIRPGDDVEQRTGVSVLGSVPTLSGPGSERRLVDLADTSGRGGFALRESLRALRTNLQFMDVDNPPRRIVVTSALPGEGKSTVAANLAITLAANGEHVALVDGDLRRPTVTETMGLVPGAGLTDVLAGRAELIEVLQRAQGHPGLIVLGAGTTPPNPSELLGSARMRGVLDELAKHAIVIIDAPPLLPVTDGAILTHQADGAILVVTVGKSTYDLVDKATAALDKVRGRVLGMVLNRVPLTGSGTTNYTYEYTSHESGALKGGDKKAKAQSGADAGARPRRTPPRRARTAEPLSADPIETDADLEKLFSERVIADAAAKRPAGGRRAASP